MKYNHDRPLSDFRDKIDKLIEGGYKPIAVSQLYFEDTFVFETNDEAMMAFKEFEVGGLGVVGWWYGRDMFLKTVSEYEGEDGAYKVLIYWLNETRM